MLRRNLVVVVLAACTRPPVQAPQPRRLGEAMVEIAMRFERAGRAADADRWDLARYDVDEIAELAERDLGADRFDEPSQRVLRQFVAVSLPALERASQQHDAHAYALANADAARVCNACHRASDKGFIEVSEQIGGESPRVARSQ